MALAVEKLQTARGATGQRKRECLDILICLQVTATIEQFRTQSIVKIADAEADINAANVSFRKRLMCACTRRQEYFV